MSKILVFGHQNPDTDAIGSSYAFAELSRLRGLDAEVVALGEVNEETAFALDYFGVTAPRVVTSAKAEGVDTVILTDHNEFQQSISDIRDVTIMGVVDHHRVANFETEAPLFMTLEPVGSASSIVYRQFKAEGRELPKATAGLLLSGLIYFSNHQRHIQLTLKSLKNWQKLLMLALKLTVLLYLKQGQIWQLNQQQNSLILMLKHSNSMATLFVWRKSTQLILQKFWNVKTRLNMLSMQLSHQMVTLTLFS